MFNFNCINQSGSGIKFKRLNHKTFNSLGFAKPQSKLNLGFKSTDLD